MAAAGCEGWGQQPLENPNLAHSALEENAGAGGWVGTSSSDSTAGKEGVGNPQNLEQAGGTFEHGGGNWKLLESAESEFEGRGPTSAADRPNESSALNGLTPGSQGYEKGRGLNSRHSERGVPFGPYRSSNNLGIASGGNKVGLHQDNLASTGSSSLLWSASSLQQTSALRLQSEAAKTSNLRLDGESAGMTGQWGTFETSERSQRSEGDNLVRSLEAKLEQCRLELAKEKAACENLRHFYGCANEKTEAGPENDLQESMVTGLQDEVASLKAQNQTQLKEMEELKKRLTEANANEKRIHSERPGLREETDVLPNEQAGEGEIKQLQSEVVLLGVQVGALKEIVRIQEGEVFRKAQVGGLQSVQKPGGAEKEEAGYLRGSRIRDGDREEAAEGEAVSKSGEGEAVDGKRISKLGDGQSVGKSGGGKFVGGSRNSESGGGHNILSESASQGTVNDNGGRESGDRKSGKGGEMEGVLYVRQLLSRWREEVYALVLESKDKEWAAVKESAELQKALNRERGLREDETTKCRVLEQKVIGLTAELQIRQEAALRSEQSLTALRSEHRTVKAAYSQAENAVRLLASSIQDWHLNEEVRLARLADSERKLQAFVKRLSFAESRVAVGRQLGRAKEAAWNWTIEKGTREEGRLEGKTGQGVVSLGERFRGGIRLQDGEGQEALEQLQMEPGISKRGDASKAGVSWGGALLRKGGVMERNRSEEVTGREEKSGGRSGAGNADVCQASETGRESAPATVARETETAVQVERARQTDCTKRVQEGIAGKLMHYQDVEQTRRRNQIGNEGVQEVLRDPPELELELQRLQQERAMLVDRVRHLEGGAQVTLLATKVAGLETELRSSIERAELAEERAANLEELLASARASLGLEGETVKQLQSQVRELELSSKRTLAREVRQAEEQARADLAAATEAHEKAATVSQSRVAALERENAKNVVNLRQLERQLAQYKEQKQRDRDARISELESRLEQKEADLHSVRRERSVLLAQLRKVEKEAHAHKRGIGEGGLRAQVVLTPAPQKVRKGREPLLEAGSAVRNGVECAAGKVSTVSEKEGRTRGEGLLGDGATQGAQGEACDQRVGEERLCGSPSVGKGMVEQEGEFASPLAVDMGPLRSILTSLEEGSDVGSVSLNDQGYTDSQLCQEPSSLSSLEGPSQRRRVSEVLDESNDDLMLRFNILAQLSSAILEESAI